MCSRRTHPLGELEPAALSAGVKAIGAGQPAAKPLAVSANQLLQAIGTDVAAETRSIADMNAAARMPVAWRAEERFANIGKFLCVSGGTNVDPPPLTLHGAQISMKCRRSYRRRVTFGTLSGC